CALVPHCSCDACTAPCIQPPPPPTPAAAGAADGHPPATTIGARTLPGCTSPRVGVGFGAAMTKNPPTDHALGLGALEARLRTDLAWLDLPAGPWMPARRHDGQAVLDVAIIGGGMAGLAAATALRQLGIAATIYDRAAPGYEGPWATTARMETLRSPKQLTGPALGLPALTFRAWFEAQFGSGAWEALDKIPRLQWMDYLRWYRRVLELEVLNGHAVQAIVPR